MCDFKIHLAVCNEADGYVLETVVEPVSSHFLDYQRIKAHSLVVNS